MNEIYQVLFSIIIFFLGASFASFLGLINYRVNKDFRLSEIWFGRSVCDKCQRELTWYEMFPVLGWIITLGKCRSCGHKIELLYPVYELILGFLFVLFYLTQQSILFYSALCFLFVFTISDIEFKEIPKIFIHLGLGYTFIFFIYRLILEYSSTGRIDINSVLPLMLGVGIVLIIVVINIIKTSFGFGDALILLMLSLVLSSSQFIKMLVTMIILGGAFAIMLVLQDRKWLKKYIPFVPFILLGFVFTLVAKL